MSFAHPEEVDRFRILLQFYTQRKFLLFRIFFSQQINIYWKEENIRRLRKRDLECRPLV